MGIIVQRFFVLAVVLPGWLMAAGCGDSVPGETGVSAGAKVEDGFRVAGSSKNSIGAEKDARSTTPELLVSTTTVSTSPSLDDLATANYTPPFPDRVDLFTPPRRPASVGESRATAGSVVVLGFIDVDGPRAVLSVDGQVAPVAQGESQFGVEVVSIKQPAVVLQRNGRRWQATLDP